MASRILSDLALPNISNIRFILWSTFMDYWKTHLSVRPLLRHRDQMAKHYRVQSLAKTLALRNLQETSDHTGVPIIMGPSSKQPILLDLMDRDMTRVRIEGAAYSWITDPWHLREPHMLLLHQHITSARVPEDLSYGLFLENFGAVLIASSFIADAMHTFNPNRNDVDIPQEVFDRYDIDQDLLNRTEEVVQKAMNRI